MPRYNGPVSLTFLPDPRPLVLVHHPDDEVDEERMKREAVVYGIRLTVEQSELVERGTMLVMDPRFPVRPLTGVNLLRPIQGTHMWPTDDRVGEDDMIEIDRGRCWRILPATGKQCPRAVPESDDLGLCGFCVVALQRLSNDD